MKKVKRILVGIDIFEKPDNVLKRALMVAEENKAALFVVHAVQTPLFSIPSYLGGKEVNIDTKGITKKIEKKIHSLNKNRQISYAVLVKEGDPGDIILYKSKLIHADMIVIGASRKNKKNTWVQQPKR